MQASGNQVPDGIFFRFYSPGDIGTGCCPPSAHALHIIYFVCRL